VSQGDTIGYIGDTGVVTGPHLHYEVHVGADVVDPIKYVNMKLGK
jgi:murein DD-endopeptidase MepM/ murein hydrolase activator NlpD